MGVGTVPTSSADCSLCCSVQSERRRGWIGRAALLRAGSMSSARKSPMSARVSAVAESNDF